MYRGILLFFLNVLKFGNETLFISDICSVWSFSFMVNHTRDFYALLIYWKNYLCLYWFPFVDISFYILYIFIIFFFFLLLRDSFCFSAELCMHLSHFPHVWTTLCIYMDRRLPGSSVHGILQAFTPGILESRNTGVGCHALHQRIFPTQGSNVCPSCLTCNGRWVLYH